MGMEDGRRSAATARLVENGSSPAVRRLLMVYAILNAVLYSMLLPLWEGFDEPFHFGYVQQLANGRAFPDARSARLSREAWQSIRLAPASDAVKANLPEVVTYSEYFSWPAARRSDAQRSLREIPAITAGNCRMPEIMKRSRRRWHTFY
jgi:hypothetical protein